MAKYYNMPNDDRPCAQFAALAACCGTMDARGENSSVHVDGDIAVATDGKLLVARQIGVGAEFLRHAVIDDKDITFPPWREALPTIDDATIVCVDPRLLAKALFAIALDDNSMYLAVKKQDRPIVMFSRDGYAVAIVMPISAGVADEMQETCKDALARFADKTVAEPPPPVVVTKDAGKQLKKKAAKK